MYAPCSFKKVACSVRHFGGRLEAVKSVQPQKVQLSQNGPCEYNELQDLVVKCCNPDDDNRLLPGVAAAAGRDLCDRLRQNYGGDEAPLPLAIPLAPEGQPGQPAQALPCLAWPEVNGDLAKLKKEFEDYERYEDAQRVSTAKKHAESTRMHLWGTQAAPINLRFDGSQPAWTGLHNLAELATALPETRPPPTDLIHDLIIRNRGASRSGTARSAACAKKGKRGNKNGDAQHRGTEKKLKAVGNCRKAKKEEKKPAAQVLDEVKRSDYPGLGPRAADTGVPGLYPNGMCEAGNALAAQAANLQRKQRRMEQGLDPEPNLIAAYAPRLVGLGAGAGATDEAAMSDDVQQLQAQKQFLHACMLDALDVALDEPSGHADDDI